MRNLLLVLISLLIWSSAFAGTTVTYIHTDHLGSPIAATNEDGSVKWREEYQPFGKQLTNQDTDNNVGFTGHKDDKDLGLSYMQARWYHPEVGRFVALDPMGTMAHLDSNNYQGFNRFNYANNNPYIYVDPDGAAASRISVEINTPAIMNIFNLLSESLGYETHPAFAVEGVNFGMVISGPNWFSDGAPGIGFSIDAVLGQDAGIETEANSFKSFIKGLMKTSYTVELDHNFDKYTAKEALTGFGDTQVGGMFGFLGGQGSINKDGDFSGFGIKYGRGINLGVNQNLTLIGGGVDTKNGFFGGGIGSGEQNDDVE